MACGGIALTGAGTTLNLKAAIERRNLSRERTQGSQGKELAGSLMAWRQFTVRVNCELGKPKTQMLVFVILAFFCGKSNRGF
jgi:hypothetical protein